MTVEQMAKKIFGARIDEGTVTVGALKHTAAEKVAIEDAGLAAHDVGAAVYDLFANFTNRGPNMTPVQMVYPSTAGCAKKAR